MRKIHLRRPSPALIVAFGALSIALAGTANALPGHDSVTKNDIRGDSVGINELREEVDPGKDDGLGKGHIRSDSIGTSELREQDEPNGGLTGDHIEPNSIGAGQLKGTTQGKGDKETIAPGENEVTVAGCEDGSEAISGGGIWDGTTSSDDLQIVASYRIGTNLWFTRVRNGEPTPKAFTPLVVCLTP